MDKNYSQLCDARADLVMIIGKTKKNNQSVCQEKFETVQGVDDNSQAMSKRLDMKYGREERIAESVLYELKSLKKVSDGDNKGFITDNSIMSYAGWICVK
ncbi:Hypothetical predicted protein [Mytilus galloprovincialis]|uniref:Uncharacterized protein n=1 Tax=Mytilus galloprovincialis TaxID=29158 RepID=A0A8B6E502_MYTGA|nr:Hypothetical predicted protein [Mytilus galloprovincialis]